ncbi:hypothetical protein KO516_06630 [Citreicella sp. C3M06]|uniref:hypothetical protein n=1 Tax=Roseobacteraceae TaxID=2854170 RepID=UPI001C082529|nr:MULTISPECIES: hypothetical protein [Roseobacteraceae]MBU2960493.1 hypothetical protein [Citreicella sp. C3M06]MDO6586878.1 hypothetical protein [Salipiger sp. 1_MG-2023]
MKRKTASPKSGKPDREARLKAALKANLARRKQQARARQDEKPQEAQSSEKDTE